MVPAGIERKLIGSVQRALDILGIFDSQTPQLGVTEVAEALGLHKSTAAGLLHTLERNGYLEQDPSSRKYRLGFRLVERAFLLLDQVELRKLALPYLQELHAWCDESINLAIRDRADVVYIERLFSSQSLGLRVEIGKRAFVHSTGLGKAMLSCLPQTEVEEIIAIRGLRPVTTHTITDHDQFLAELERSRERGYAIDDEENELGARCVSAPILDHTGRPVAAVSISVPLPRIPMAEVPRFGARVKEAAKQISRQLGYLPRPY